MENTNNVRNILLFGRTGNGKSTLGNVLINKNDKFEEVFKESASRVSETKSGPTETFEISGIRYQVIDTIGIGDTKLSGKEVLYKIGEAANKVRDGLNRLFFVTGSRFTAEEISAYNMLRDVVFDKYIVDYTTIVCTRFPNFGDYEECNKDKLRMKEENDFLAEIIESCGNNVVHVDNPPLNIKDPRKLQINKEDRENSRNKLLLHLGNCQGIYKPKNLDDLNARIGSYMTEIEILEKRLEDEKRLNSKQRSELQEQINKLKGSVSQETKGYFQRILGRVAETTGYVMDETVDAVGEGIRKSVEFVRDDCRIM